MRDLLKRSVLGLGLTAGSVVLTSTFTVSVAGAESRVLSGPELYQRCYIRLVRKPPMEADPLLVRVKAGTLGAEQACLSLFDRGLFEASTGRVKNPADTEAVEIVRTMHDLHRSFFQSRRFAGSGSGAAQLSTAIVKDMEEPALFFTRAALLSGTRVDSVLKLNSGLKGLRERPATSKLNNFEAQRFARMTEFPSAMSLSYAQPPVGLAVDDSEIVETGTLVGVAATTPLRVPSMLLPGIGNAELRTATVAATTNVDLRKHHGGGILGSQGFIMSNLNVPINRFPEGEGEINRRLTSRIYQDLMCHEMPTLETQDVEGDVIRGSQYAFRNDASCMRCHSSLDPLAMTYKNIIQLSSSRDVSAQNREGMPVVSMISVGTKAGSTQFNLQAPTGQLRYRELLTGALIEHNVTNIADAANKIASGKDFYTCAAKRYYKFFTGIDVPLRPLDPASTTFELDKVHQNKIVELANVLKTSQSVRTLFSEIFKSEAFKSSDYKSQLYKEAK